MRPVPILVLALVLLCCVGCGGSEARLAREISEVLVSEGASVHSVATPPGSAQVDIDVSTEASIDPVDTFRVLGVLSATPELERLVVVFHQVQSDGTGLVTQYIWDSQEMRLERFEGEEPRPGADCTAFQTGVVEHVTQEFVMAVASGEESPPSFGPADLVTLKWDDDARAALAELLDAQVEIDVNPGFEGIREIIVPTSAEHERGILVFEDMVTTLRFVKVEDAGTAKDYLSAVADAQGPSSGVTPTMFGDNAGFLVERFSPPPQWNENELAREKTGIPEGSVTALWSHDSIIMVLSSTMKSADELRQCINGVMVRPLDDHASE